MIHTLHNTIKIGLTYNNYYFPQRLLVSTTVAQLTAKMDQIKTLDEAIVATIQDEEELETEVCDANTYLTTLEERIASLTEFIKRASQLPMTRPPTPRKITTESRESPKLLSTVSDAHESEVVKKPVYSPAAAVDTHETPHVNETHNYSRLPKLALPTFNGDPLQWQTFWDSFSAAVHCNPRLSGAQKFNYLCTQLQGTQPTSSVVFH